MSRPRNEPQGYGRLIAAALEPVSRSRAGQAEALGISQQALSMLLAGKTTPPPYARYALGLAGAAIEALEPDVIRSLSLRAQELAEHPELMLDRELDSDAYDVAWSALLGACPTQTLRDLLGEMANMGAPRNLTTQIEAALREAETHDAVTDGEVSGLRRKLSGSS